MRDNASNKALYLIQIITLQNFTLQDQTLYCIMALRRPPTRLELKADDIDEYTKVSDQ